MRIKLHNTEKQPPEVKEAILSVLSSGRFVKGEKTTEFEEKWAKRCRMNYAVAVASGSVALELTIARLFGWGEVSYPSWTFKAVKNAILRNKNKAVIDDKRPSLFAHHHHETKLDYMPKLEDCSHCHGYTPKADTAIFSMFPAKILGAIGDAGMIVCNKKEDADWYRDARNHGITNGRMDEIQAAVLLAKLPYLDEIIQKRKETVRQYDRALNRHTEGEYFYAYCIDAPKEHFSKRDIETNYYYTDKELAIPIHEYLTQEDKQKIICALLVL